MLIAAPDQIAQLFISPYLHLELSIGMPPALQTLRGDKAFGSSNLTCPGAKIWSKLPNMNKPEPAEAIAQGPKCDCC